MTESDTLYRAYKNLYKELSSDQSFSKTLDSVANAPDGESVTVTHNVCHVDTEWLTEIERGLVFIDRALGEDRQFIRSDGEVKPIEKVKHVSKESVRYLSRHSDLITREQKKDIVPDKLYTIEKESDYAVYENKFLYLLLCLIREFVTVRYEAIASAYKEYLGEYEVTKTIKTQTRTLKFSFKMTDEQSDAIFAPADNECAQAVLRMDKIIASVNFYLHTPIMQEVSRADKIKGAITKTNILLMNKNFFGALKLYEYLRAYEEDGYTIEKRVDDLELSAEVKRELAVPPLLSAFTVYEHGLGLENHLQAEFEKEELRRAEETQKELQRKLTALKNRIARTGESMEEYVLMLEERNAIIENSYTLLQDALKKIDDVTLKMSRMQNEIDMLLDDIEKLNEEILKREEELKRAQEEHKRQLEELKNNFEAEITKLNAAHAEELSALKAEHENRIAALNEEHNTALAAAKKRAQEQYDALKKQSEEQTARLIEAHKKETENLRSEQKNRLEAINAEHSRELSKTRAEYEKRIADNVSMADESASRAREALDSLEKTRTELKFTSSERDVLRARLTAVRKEQGLLTAADDFTTEEGFNALEHEFEVLGRLLNDEWKGVKASLRKEILGAKRSSSRKKQQKSKEYTELKEFLRSEREEENSVKTPNGDGDSGSQATGA